MTVFVLFVLSAAFYFPTVELVGRPVQGCSVFLSIRSLIASICPLCWIQISNDWIFYVYLNSTRIFMSNREAKLIKKSVTKEKSWTPEHFSGLSQLHYVQGDQHKLNYLYMFDLFIYLLALVSKLVKNITVLRFRLYTFMCFYLKSGGCSCLYYNGR